jgi:hypothetical protein
MTVDTKRELLDLSACAWHRLRGRLDGLTDDEYFWEPGPDVWTIRREVIEYLGGAR